VHMPRPTSRVLTLLELLQSGGTRTVAELADRLGVDGRTVRRYVDHLIDLDVPVDSVRGPRPARPAASSRHAFSTSPDPSTRMTRQLNADDDKPPDTMTRTPTSSRGQDNQCLIQSKVASAAGADLALEGLS
jgi:hypothetical protein